MILALLSALLFLLCPLLANSQTSGQPLQLMNPNSQGAPAGQAPVALHDIRGPLELPEPFPYLIGGLIALGALALLLALFWWYRRRPAPAAPTIPPGVAARSELMQARELMSEEQALYYMERVSQILRRYLEQRFALATTRQTTREFFRTVQGTPVLAEFRDQLKTCLEQCDKAKFAHHPAPLAALEQMEESILRFVNSSEDESCATQPKGGA